MARPVKKGLKYFNIDCVQEDNLNYVEAKHGIQGYGILVKLWRKIYMVEGYYTEWNEKNLFLFSREIGVGTDLITEVVNSCFQEGIFDKPMFQEHQILTSRGIQRRFIKIVTEAKRKDHEIVEKYLISELTPENHEFPPEETPKIPELSTQKKRKERKVKEKKNSSGAVPAKPTRAKKVVKEKIPEPYWQELVDVYFEFVKEKFVDPPLFADQDPKHFKAVLQKLKKRAADQKKHWTAETAPARLRVFLNHAFSDPWLAKHFLLKNLNEKFEAIGRDVEKISALVKQQTSMDPETEIQQLYERFQNGKPNELCIAEAHYDFLKLKGMVRTNKGHLQQGYDRRMKSLTGSNQAKDLRLLQDYQIDSKAASATDPEFPKTVKRIVVLEYFYLLEKDNIKTVFHEQAV